MSKRSFLVAFIISGMLLVSFSMLGHGVDVLSLGEISVKLYMLDLDGVSSHGVNNVSQTVEGVIDASRNTTAYFTIYVPHYYALNVSTTVTIIRDWGSYVSLIETGSNIVIVNAHGETLPVPANYSREAWVTKIAEALAYRNVTWVHTALYPFYYTHYQASEENVWGEDGFRQFVSFIGIQNATCSANDEKQPRGMDLLTADSINQGWDVGGARLAQEGRPLHGSDFQNYTIMPIWGYETQLMPGGVIRFCRADSASNYGYYVHVGTNNTFKGDGTPTAGDYWRGYIGTAAALRIWSFRLATEEWITKAEKAISQAENEGRVIGLEEARSFFEKARKDGDNDFFVYALLDAKSAYESALNASKPVLSMNAYTWIAIFGLVIGSCAAGLLVERRKNRAKREG